jgi:catechol 2,3-dioxygenase-like lactoylglutathione lyase family enzyme
MKTAAWFRFVGSPIAFGFLSSTLLNLNTLEIGIRRPRVLVEAGPGIADPARDCRCRSPRLRRERRMPACRLVNCAAVFPTPDLRRAVDWYREKLAFRAVEKFDAPEPFAALYRDGVEIILVRAESGTVERNRVRYGAGYDAYLAPEDPAQVDAFHAELSGRGVKIVRPPERTAYGSREMVFEDVDGRWIGVGCIEDENAFRGAAQQP